MNGVGRFLSRALFKSRNRELVYKCSPELSKTISRFTDAFGKADTARMKKKDFSKTKGEPQPLLEQNIEEAGIVLWRRTRGAHGRRNSKSRNKILDTVS